MSVCGSLSPEAADCAGHGFCLPSGVCACDPGWTGASDVVGRPAQDCQINTDAVFALWLAVAVGEFVHLAINLTLPDWRFSAGHLFRSFRDKPAFRAIVYHLSVAVFFIALAVYKIAYYPSELPAIGHDLAATILYVFGACAHYAAMLTNMWMWQGIVANSNTTLSFGQIGLAVRPFKIYGMAGFGLVLINNMLLFAIYAHPDQQEALGTAFWVIRGFRIICFACADWLATRKFCSLLESSTQRMSDDPRGPSFPEMHASLTTYMRRLVISASVVSISSFVIGIWPFVRTLGGYFLPIDCVLVIVAKFALLRTIQYSRSLSSRRPSQPAPPVYMDPTSRLSPGRRDSQRLSDPPSRSDLSQLSTPRQQLPLVPAPFGSGGSGGSGGAVQPPARVPSLPSISSAVSSINRTPSLNSDLNAAAQS